MIVFSLLNGSVKCNLMGLVNDEQLFGSELTLCNVHLDSMCPWGLRCVVCEECLLVG